MGDLLSNLGTRHAEMARLRRYYVGEQDAICSEIFSQVLTEEQQQELNFYRLFVNLTAPSVDRLVSGVYGGIVTRNIEEGSPYKAQLDELLSPGRGYGQAVRDWFCNAVLFGTGWMVWEARDGKATPYIPNPVYTKVETEPWDCSKIVELKEYSPCGKFFKFVNKYSYGVANEDTGEIIEQVEHQLGFAPVVAAYGKSQVSFGSAYGISMVRDSIKYSDVISRIQLAAIQLVLTYTRPQATLTGEILTQTENPEAEMAEMLAPGGVAHLKEGGSFDYASPKSDFDNLLKMIEYIKKEYCLTAGIPIDALDSSTIDPNQSATAARLRNQPLKTSLQKLTEAMKICEIASLQVAAAVTQWLDTSNPVTFGDIQEKVRVNISMEPAGSPESRTDEVTAWIQLYTIGAKTLEDLIRHFNGDVSESEIRKRIADHKARSVQTPAPPKPEVPSVDTADTQEAA